MSGPYALYLGKLAPKQGNDRISFASSSVRASIGRSSIAGDGPERAAIEQDAARSGRDIRLVGWVDQASAAAWMAHASMLVFPSRGPESLSRVLLEASALGVPIAAMNTGGTSDIVVHERHGSPVGHTGSSWLTIFDGCEMIEPLRARLGAAASVHAASTFDTSIVVPRIERLYVESGGETPVRPVTRVAVVARSVFPLHGLGGLERSVYDLVRALSRSRVWRSP